MKNYIDKSVVNNWMWIDILLLNWKKLMGCEGKCQIVSNPMFDELQKS